MTIEIFVENSHELLDNQWNWTDETNSKKKTTIQYDEITCENEFLLCLYFCYKCGCWACTFKCIVNAREFYFCTVLRDTEFLYLQKDLCIGRNHKLCIFDANVTHFQMYRQTFRAILQCLAYIARWFNVNNKMRPKYYDDLSIHFDG